MNITTATHRAVSLIGLLMLACVAQAGQYNRVIDIGAKMPDFKDLPSTSGQKISSQDLDSEVVVLVLLANHCPWVRGMDADLVKLADQFKGEDVQIVAFGVNLREDDRLPAMQAHAEKNGYTFEYLFDESQQLGRQLGATRTPEYFVFDSDRSLVYMGLLYNSPAKQNPDGSVHHINGEPTEFYVADAIKATLNGESVAVAETRAHGCSAKYE